MQPSPVAYEVRQNTHCQGWINTWFVMGEHGAMVPETFATAELASSALDAHLIEIDEEIASGERAADEGYSRDEFCIVAVGAP